MDGYLRLKGVCVIKDVTIKGYIPHQPRCHPLPDQDRQGRYPPQERHQEGYRRDLCHGVFREV
ncbi:MAG: hypothetical protein MZU95_14100 [Desulfomicrobium escambiense]|nr:hypothetical protein [Desulfomicrobium escambiense]